MTSYTEDIIDEFGMSIKWHNATLLDNITTSRGTQLEMIYRPLWGTACYMNNSVQSCTLDERIYHESLVHPVMLSTQSRKRVMIIGGGEGATAREVLKWPDVEHVDMYEWDQDVVTLFSSKYTEWGQDAWNDSRLHIHFQDIFSTITTSPQEKYDIVIIDLFEPCDENQTQWNILLRNINKWVKICGSVVMYSGMRNMLVAQQPYQTLMTMLGHSDVWRGIILDDLIYSRTITPYKVYIPSFSGESSFILISRQSLLLFDDLHFKNMDSHLTPDVWNSYKTLNW
jgi:predicted membrane-bound spermidine synthase